MAAGNIFAGELGNLVKKTLRAIVQDDDGAKENALVLKQYCEVIDMEDAFDDYLEMSGVPLAQEIGDGVELPSVNMQEGYITRLIPRKFGMKMGITKEALKDNKYPKAIRCAKKMETAMYKTAEYDAANIWNRATNTSYVGGDALPLASASHTLPGGGTFSNLGTAIAPSEAAFIVHRAQMHEMPDHTGYLGSGLELKKVVFPVNQLGTWEVLTGSKTSPEAGVFGAINVVEKAKLQLVPVVYWTASDTNYAYLTDCEEGLKFAWRDRPESSDWVENSQQIMMYGIDARWDKKWIDPRCVLFVNA